jgi:2-C-methyl-D-erythritol 4-phosphate cytidylyltransferase/2-C-methyl-D-erythritol 2,4-cyclodiphosphate synthase
VSAPGASVVALVLGAGLGTRLGAGLPKGWVRLHGHTLLEWSAAALAAAASVDAVLPVVPPQGGGPPLELPSAWPRRARLLASAAGGATRQASLAAGLVSLAEQTPTAEWVLVHDAARCLVEPADAEAVLAAAQRAGAALPVLPLVDTLKEVEAGWVRGTLERARFAAAQTPQAFRLEWLREALAAAQREGFEATDCASLLERRGLPVAAVAGRAQNFKITGPADLERAEQLLRARAARVAVGVPEGRRGER